MTGGQRWSGRLWAIAGLLGVATFVLAVSLVHDAGRMRNAARSIAASRAGQAAALAASRLEVLALETFAPVAPWSTRPASSPRAGLEALVAGQRAAARCACRDTLPADAFFHFDVATGALEAVSRDDGRPLPLAESTLVTVARSEVRRASSRASSSPHLVAAPELGDRGAVTMTRYDESGMPTEVFGLVGPARWLLASLFEREAGGVVASASTGDAGRLDTSAVEVATTRGARLIGGVSADRPFRGTVTPRGSLDGLTVTVGLSSAQVPVRLFASKAELFHLAVLVLCTALVIGFAIGSSRRELLLARARSDFIAGVSHDLRMPLAQILIAGETIALARERDPSDRERLATSIVREARRLVGLVDNVMLFSRAGAVSLQTRPSPLAVRVLFDEVAESVRLALEDARQVLAVDASPVWVATDRALLRQALVNLIDNSLKYGAPGQTIRLSAALDGPSRARLYVDDTGPGIPAADRARVFDAYERLGRDQASERTGAGLGLAVVKEIVVACGGRVWLEEAPGGGTRAVIEVAAAYAPTPVGEASPA